MNYIVVFRRILMSLFFAYRDGTLIRNVDDVIEVEYFSPDNSEYVIRDSNTFREEVLR